MRLFAIFVSTVITIFLSVVAYAAFYHRGLEAYFIGQALVFVIGYLVYRRLTRKLRHRKRLKQMPFPEEWEQILQENVRFYNNLSPEDKARFRYRVQVFLAEKRITGVRTTISDTDRVLVAAGAIIPLFGFPDWDYTNLNEILLYPGGFRQDFAQEGADRNVLGMVGTGYMNGMMILSQPALRQGFKNPEDGHNVGIHEFVHLLDKMDGNTDGLPQSLLDKTYALPWLDLMRKEMKKIKAGKSRLNEYAATGEEEFLAVAGEYFFEQPEKLRERYPELYNLLSRIFKQKLKY